MKKALSLSTILTALTVSLLFAAPAKAEFIYRGLLINNGVALDMRPQRFNFGGGGLSLNKVLANLLAVNPNTQCALRLDTTNPIPNVGDQSQVHDLPQGYMATFDQGVGGLPAGHVSLTTNADPAAQDFSTNLRLESEQNPAQFNDRFIVSIAGTEVADEECRDYQKQFQ